MRLLLASHEVFSTQSRKRIPYLFSVFHQPARERLLTTAVREQVNIEKTVLQAALELEDVKELPEKEPEPDWVARWISSVKDVSSEEVRQLWARVLAGEIKGPGSFSLRTLDALRNISQADAALFERLTRKAVVWEYVAFVPQEQDASSEWERTNRSLGRYLSGIGLMLEMPGMISVMAKSTKQTVFRYGEKRALLVQQIDPPVAVNLSVWQFTPTGTELMRLVERDADEVSLLILADQLRKRGFKPIIGNVIIKQDRTCELEPDPEPSSL